MSSQPQIVKRFGELETTARSLGLSLAATDTEFLLRPGSGEVWAQCSDLDDIEEAIEAYSVYTTGQPPR